MSEEKGKDESDVVSRDDYNKIVEAHNSMKVEAERLRSEKEVLAKQVESKSEAQNDSAEWKSFMETQKNQIRELEEKLERQSSATEKIVAKGVVNNPPKRELSADEVQDNARQVLEKTFPDRKVIPEQFSSAIQRYGFYKSPSTRTYTDEQLGQLISLQASAASLDPSIIPKEARMRNNDVVVNKTF